MRQLKQITIPKCLRLDDLNSHHYSIAAGGHSSIIKVSNSLKILLERYVSG